jgi:glycosyltransferase involved in cell wall biosynthesis
VSEAPRILHLHSTFDAGGKELRCVRLINAFGGEFRHAIVSGDLERRSAAALLDPKLKVAWPKFPPLPASPGRRASRGSPRQWRVSTSSAPTTGARWMRRWRTRSSPDVYKLPPLVHHEDGFNEDEAGGLKPSRNLYRRIALGRSAAVVVPSRTLERIALETWQQARSKVRLIPNGIDTAAYARPQRRDALPRLIKRKGELWVGTLAGLRKVKDLPALVRAVRDLPEEWQLVIAGEGPERPAILAAAEACGIEHRVHLPGFVAEPAKVIGLFDVFALSSRSEQFPISIVEAMAAGLPVAAPRVGDIAAMVASENGPYLSAPGDEVGLARTLQHFAADPALRRRVGEANRAKAAAEYDETRMIERYRALYGALAASA